MQVKKLEKIEKQADKELEKVKDIKSLKEIKIKFLGRKGVLTNILRSIKDVAKEKRAEIGSEANNIKKQIEEKIKEAKNRIDAQKVIDEDSHLDVTAPGIKQKIGHINPDTLMMWEIENVFQKMGFDVYEPYIVDNDYNNFQALNIPEDHPARDIWDTFWTENDLIPITHTSSMQNRILRNNKPPIRAIVIGKTFRNERTDARHEHSLYQCEGIYVDKGISLSDMIGTLKEFFSRIFEKKVNVQITPDYFPFVEPGNAMNLSCVLCDQKGCRVCKYTGWLEIMGCGMIHPNVLKEGGIDPDTYSGFAWGFGVDRLAMLKYKINDVRLFHSGDLRFIQQF